MRKALFILLSGIFCALTQPMSAQIIAPDSLVSDTLISIANDTLVSDSMPEWYVAPEIPLFLRAPKHTAATACNKVAAIRTYDINSQLVEATYYEYDNAGRVISTTVWTHNADGSQTGKSKQEYSFDAYGNQVSTVVYDWDNTMNIWHGVSRYEYVYDAEQRMLSNTEYAWVNYAWAADTKYTWAYDAEGREAEYFSYKRNTTTNQLEPVNGFVYTWLSDTQKSLEIIYTTYSNGAWNGGTKKEWAFDAEGRQTSYAYYSTITNGNWVGSSKETWTYGGPAGQLTLYEKFGWANNNWSKTVKEETEYSGANIVRIENYTYANGVTTGTRKEEYTYENNKPKQTIIYAWSNGMWIGSSNETWLYGGPSGQLTLHEKFEWSNNDWSKTLKEETEYSGANIVRIENYTYTNGEPTGTKKELTTYSGGKKTEILTFVWENGDWVNSNKETWEFNGPSGKQTKHEKCEWSGSDWTVMVQENTTYNGNTTTIENYERLAGVWTGTKKEENTVTGGKKTETIIYAWDTDHWVELSKEKWGYTSGKQTLHELYEWYNNNWSVTLRELAAFDAAGNQTLIENYTGSEGVVTGTQKEQYAYTGSIKTSSIIYAWTNDDWVESLKEVWGFTSGKQTLYETYAWNGNWVKTLQENTTYDGDNITKIENYALVEGVWAGTQKEEYTYTSGEKTRTIASVWAENDWVYSTKNEAGYWDGNVEISATNYAWDGSTWIGTGTRTKTTYDGTKVIEKLTENWPNGATDWTNAAITTNTYDADGVNILTYNGTWNGTRWVVYSMTRTDIIWDDFGNQLLKATWKCSSDSIWIGVQKDTAAYTASNQLLYSAQYTSWANNKWVASYRVEYVYDSANRVTLNQRYDWKNNKWQGKYKYEYEYDAQGRQTMSATYSSWNKSTNNWVGSSKKTTEYDNEGRIKSMTTYKWSNNKWLEQYLYSYLYDNTGREIEQIVQFYSGGKWANMLKYENAYSGNKQTKANTYSWLNNQWVYSSLAESTYDEISTETLRRQVNGSWASGSLTSYSDNYYFYNCDPHFYTVGFMNYDGKGLAYNTQKEGQMPVYNGATPTKPSTTESTFTFDGWTPEVVAVTGEATYTATFTETKNKYTITWLNEDGSTIIDQTEVTYGELPEHADVSKDNTAQYTYTFTGWSPTITAVTGNASYTAQFNSTVNKYTITFKNGNEVLQSTEVAFGEKPVYGGSIPTKDPDDQYRYAFAGWDKEIVEVAGEETYTATFSTTTNEYTISWFNDDNTLIDQTTVAYGVVPTHEDPTKENTAEWTYTFSGWDHDPVAVTGNASYKATYTKTKNKYTITWLNEDGDEIEHETLEYGKTPEHTAPVKENTAEWTYTFTGWDPAIESVKGDASYKATFSATKNSYTITFLNYNGEVLQSTNVEYGVKPVYEGAIPAKPEDDEFHYAFAGWDKEIVEVAGEETYTATFSTTTNEYTISWFNDDNTLIDQTTVPYGVVPTHEDPTKENTAEFTYTFARWDHDPVAVTGNASYKATYNATKNSYTITWKDDEGKEICSDVLAYGETPKHEDLSKENTAEWTYTFTGWTPTIESVKGDASYKATFSATKNSYTIQFLNYNGEVLQSANVEYGVKPEYKGSVPVKPEDDEYHYAFAGWDKEIVEVGGPETYTATFSTTTNEYTISWFNDDNTLIDQTTVAYGVVPTHEDPTKENTAEFTYTFAGWDHDPVAVIGNASYTATYNATKNKYLVVFQDEGGTELQSGEVEYGTTPEYFGAQPSKEATAQYTYAFAGWDPEITAVEGAQTYTAKYSSTVNSYTITWLNEDGSELSHETLEYGVTPQHEDLSKENTAEWTYTFTGWTPAIESVKGDASYQATFSATKNSYTITWLNEDGSEIEHETLEYGATPSHADIYKESTEEFTYTFIGWTPSIVPVNGDAAYKAVFEATPVDPSSKTFTITFLHDDGITILEQVTVEYGEIPVCRYTPTKMGDAEHYYTFVGWSPEIVPATCNASYTPLFELIARQYVITFKNYDGKVLQTAKVDYGAIPEYTGATPTRNGTTQYAYVFTGWTPELAPVTKEATYKATFERTARIYTVIYYDEDGETELDRVEVAYGQMPHTSVVPTKEEDEEYYYVFIGWTPYVTFVTKDASYSALFQKKNKLEGIEDVESEEQAVKIFKNNILYILRAGKIYTVDGKLVEEYYL